MNNHTASVEPVVPNPGERGEPARTLGERATLVGALDFQRATFQDRCADLNDAQLAMRSVPPSNLSLLGLLRHLADVEQHWVGNAIGGEHIPSRYSTDQSPNDDFDALDTDTPATVFADWVRACEHSREIVAARELDVTGSMRGKPCSVRWVLMHVTQEYARHNGHADLLREAIDGKVGE